MPNKDDPGVWARVATILVGSWLFISAFAWPHTTYAQTSTWIVGALFVVFAVAALVQPAMRWANTLLAVWLFMSTWFMSQLDSGTRWNAVVVSLVVFLLSVMPSRPLHLGRHGPMGAT